MKILKPKKPLESLIVTLRGQRVLLDADLAEIYGVPTRRLNEQVKRNASRFPEDFMFQLTAPELENLKSQFATSSLAMTNPDGAAPDESKIAAHSHGGRRKLPRAFTEHGAIMAATVLNSPEAVTMSVYVVRAFVQMREHLTANLTILKRLAEIDKTLLQHDSALRDVYQKLRPLLQPPPEPPGPPKRRIGFKPESPASS